MNWQLFVSTRYLTSRHKEKFISLISLISVCGVAVGVAALIIVIAVMSGFDDNLKEKIIGTNSHIIIESEYGLQPSGKILSRILSTNHVVAASFFLHGQALIRRDENVTGVIVKGIDPSREAKTASLTAYLTKGTLDFKGGGVVIGSELADRLKLKLGDTLSIFSSAAIKGKEYTVCGIFTSGMYEYDMNLIYMGIPQAQELFGTDNLVSGVAVKVDDAFNVTNVKDVLKGKMGSSFTVRTWMDLNKNLLAALKLEKTVMFLILALIVMVACFNIASTLIMTVLEKTKDIGILKAIGSTQANVMAIFAMTGAMIGVLGTALGAALGVAISWCLKTYHFVTLPKDIYYIDTLPVKLQLQDITLIVVSSLLITLVATLYPSYKASRLDPVEALRYE